MVLWGGAVSYEQGTPAKGVCCRRMLREGEHALVDTAKGGRLGREMLRATPEGVAELGNDCEDGSYLRLINFCITQPRLESNKKEEKNGFAPSTRSGRGDPVAPLQITRFNDRDPLFDQAAQHDFYKFVCYGKPWFHAKIAYNPVS